MAPRKRNKRMDAAIDAMRPFGFKDSLIRQHVRQLLKVYGGDDYWLFIEENCYKVLLENLLEANAKEREDSDEEGEEGTHLQNILQEQEAPPASVCLTPINVANSNPVGSDVMQALSESVMLEVEENVAPPESCSPPARNTNYDKPTEGNRNGLNDIIFCLSSDEETPIAVSNDDEIDQTHIEVEENVAPPEGSSPLARNTEHDPPAEGNGNSLKDIILYQSSNKETSIAVSNNDEFAQICVTSPSPTTAVSVRPANHLATSRACFGWIDLESDEDEDERTLEFTCLTPAPRQTPTPLLLPEHSGGGRNKRVRQSRWDLKPRDP